MTDKEALDWLISRKEHYEMDDNCQELAEAIQIGINAIEQEPCEDAISRQAAIDACLNGWNKGYKEIVEEIRTLPSVTPQQKMGRWIRVDKDKLRCSECEVIHLIAQYPNGKVDWCPNCGAKMLEVEE